MFFFFNDTATTEIYTLSLHDALPISEIPHGTGTYSTRRGDSHEDGTAHAPQCGIDASGNPGRSEEHTSELQSPCNLVCRLLLEKKKRDVSIVAVFQSPTLTQAKHEQF